MTSTIGTLNTHVVLNCLIFPQNSNDVVPYARHFLPVKFFFPKYYFNHYVSSYRKMQLRPMNNARDQHEYRHKWVKAGVYMNRSEI